MDREMSRHMGRVDSIITQLDLLNEKSKRASKKKISEQECRKVFDEICAFYPEAPLDDRIDIHLAFEGHDALMRTLLAYMTRLMQEIPALIRKGKRQDAIAALQRVLVANVIVDKCAQEDTLKRIQDDASKAAQELHYKVASFLQRLEIPAGVYVERAQYYYKHQNAPQAIRALGRALQSDESLHKNEKIGEFAALLTEKAPHSAIMVLEDSFLRNTVIRELDNKHRLQQAKTQEAAAVNRVTETGLLQRVLKGVLAGRRS
jgi:hypothetical protein